MNIAKNSKLNFIKDLYICYRKHIIVEDIKSIVIKKILLKYLYHKWRNLDRLMTYYPIFNIVIFCLMPLDLFLNLPHEIIFN